MVLLSESTSDQLLEELYDRFSDLVMCAVRRYPDGEDQEGDFWYASHGKYVMKRGLHAVIGEHLEDDAREVFQEWKDKKGDN